MISVLKRRKIIKNRFYQGVCMFASTVTVMTGTIHTFEIEHRSNNWGKHALIRLAKSWIKGIMLLLVIATVSFILYYFLHITFFRRITQAFVFVIFISPLLPIFSYFQRDRKNPAYGINPEGFLLNERGWHAAFFTWNEVASIKEFDHPKFGKELHIKFVSYSMAINKPNQKFRQSLQREYEIQKQPVKISRELVKGDVTPFIHKFIEYFEKHKMENPGINQEEAEKIAEAYIFQYSLPIKLKGAKAERLEEYLNYESPVWVFTIKDLEYKVIVSVFNEMVECMVNQQGQQLYPHYDEYPVKKEEAIAIAKAYIKNSKNELKLMEDHIFYYVDGLENIEDPVWVVQTELPENSFDGNTYLDLLISARTKKVEETLTS